MKISMNKDYGLFHQRTDLLSIDVNEIHSYSTLLGSNYRMC